MIGAVLARLGLGKMLGVFMRPGILVAFGLLAVLVAGIFGAWWGLNNNRHVAEAWRVRAQGLEQRLASWELLLQQDSEQALQDSGALEQATNILEGEKREDNENSIIARWGSGDIGLFLRLRKTAQAGR